METWVTIYARIAGEANGFIRLSPATRGACLERNQSPCDPVSFVQGRRSLHPSDEDLSEGPRPEGRVNFGAVLSGYTNSGFALGGGCGAREAIHGSWTTFMGPKYLKTA